jgi:hypothetical protein
MNGSSKSVSDNPVIQTSGSGQEDAMISELNKRVTCSAASRGKDGMATPAPLQEPLNFSLALGGPLYRSITRPHLPGQVPQFLSRQAAMAVLLCWVPLAVLSLAQGHFLCGIKLSFLRDIETHVRFLVSLPVLIMAEMVVHLRIRPINLSNGIWSVRKGCRSIMLRLMQACIFTTRSFPKLRFSSLCTPVVCGSGGIRLQWISQAGMPRRKGADTPDDGRILACVHQRAGLPVHPAALVYADPDLLLVFAPGFASQIAFAVFTSRSGRGTCLRRRIQHGLCSVVVRT